jgi:prepilin-type N-terminal cleavage/methylation domain-containing protein
MKIPNKNRKFAARRAPAAGFTMIELLVCVAMFVVIGGAAFSLFKQHAPLFTQQQALTGLNVTMRNAVAEMQMDVVNAGSGYYPSTNFPDWPIGITILNNPPSSSCYNAATHTYTSTCFDTLNIIAMDQATSPSHAAGNSAGTTCADSTTTTMYALPPTGISASTLASSFHSGDQILLVKNDGSQITTTLLTSNGVVSGTTVQLNHNATNSDGSNSSTTMDPLSITTHASGKLGTSFCNTDWVMKLAPVTYAVDATDPTDPKLTRKQNGTTDVIAEQIIGFKVGASIWNSASYASTDFYAFDASTYSYNYSLIRSVQLSLIGRTSPGQGSPSGFTNNFDQGNYQIQSISLAVNPRNLSMRD